MGFDFYMTEIVNYSEKSFLVNFGYINQKGKQTPGADLFVPKKAVTKINFVKKIICLEGWWYAKNGFVWHCLVNRCKGKAVLELRRISSFNPEFPNYTSIPGSIQLIGELDHQYHESILKMK